MNYGSTRRRRVGRRGVPQHPADRLDAELVAELVDELDYLDTSRSSARSPARRTDTRPSYVWRAYID
jgi:hypothetical protein